MSTMDTPSVAKANLDPAALALSGRHLIEASAGTGKTYNITRLYIRLVVERRLPVQQILVMTFTKAATEELRGRIDRELRQAAMHWGRLGSSDPFFHALEARVDAAQAVPLLQSALLHLDEAAIFTIHGFCARVLKQHALASDLPLELEMEADTSEQALEAVRDWLRSIAHSDAYDLLSERGWHTPEGFLQLFGRAVRSRAELLAAEPARFRADALAQKSAVLAELRAHESAIVERLISSHKERDKRQQEWGCLLEWLGSDEIGALPKPANDFIHGNRLRNDEELKAWLLPVKQLKEQVPKLAAAADKAEAYPLVKAGIAQIRERFAAAKQQQGLMDFDDLIALLAERVQSGEGDALVRALRQQYPVALVDEFQDTDPDQYAILERVYPRRAALDVSEASGSSALFMIGDPKQAIYAFRGGDIFTYLRAREDADDSWHMDTNWRSVPAMVTGYNRLFWGAPLESPAQAVFGFGIDYEPVQSAKAKQARITRLWDPASDGSDSSGEGAGRRALNYVCFEPGDGEVVNAPFRHAIADWCVTEIDRLLNQARLGADHTEARAVEERDIAILVRTGTEAAIVQQALQGAGYPSVYLSARDNLFASPEAAELVPVLKGILGCEDSRLLLAACATRLLGGDAAQLAALNQDADALVERRYALMALRERWQREGFIPVMMSLIHDHLRPPPERHERCLTNYIHLAELLQQASGNLRHPQQLLEWLLAQIQSGGSGSEAELRLESDANLIRIVTQHGSKGLEYPIVFVPFATYPKDPIRQGNSKQEFFSYHDPERGVALQQVGSTDAADAAATAEGYAEAIRLLYVAVTRAEQRCYLGVASFKSSANSPLARTLGMGERESGEPEWAALLATLVADERESCALIRVDDGAITPVRRQARAASEQPVAAAQFRGRIERDWRLSSFSALTRNLGHARRDRKDHDDDHDAAQAVPAELPLRFRLAKGAAAGNLLHDVLEHTDFSAPRWSETLRDPLLRFGQLEPADEPRLIGWLQECLEAPLPAIGAGASLRLADLSWPLTLREAEFYFPLDGAMVGRLTQLLQRHRGSADAIELPGPHRLKGMMHGFIDLIFEHQGRYYVADYKSTYLGNRLADYDTEVLRANNEVHFYDLQYLIYAVALHRYLGARLPDYNPEQHFGGVYYLYLRGMAPGAESGVFHTAIEVELLQALDALFGGDVPAPVVASSTTTSTMAAPEQGELGL